MKKITTQRNSRNARHTHSRALRGNMQVWVDMELIKTFADKNICAHVPSLRDNGYCGDAHHLLSRLPHHGMDKEYKKPGRFARGVVLIMVFIILAAVLR